MNIKRLLLIGLSTALIYFIVLLLLGFLMLSTVYRQKAQLENALQQNYCIPSNTYHQPKTDIEPQTYKPVIRLR